MVPEEWNNRKLSNLIKSSAFGPRFSSDLYSTNGAVGTIRTTDLSISGHIEYSTIPYAALDPKLYQEHILNDGDLLITRSGTCGIATIFRAQKKPIVAGAFLIRFQLNEKINELFLHALLMSSEVQSKIARMAAGGVQKNLTGTSLKKLELLIPPLPEQRKIAKILQTWDRAIATTEKLIDASKQQKKALMQQLLTGKKRFAGFEGEWETVSIGEVCKVSGGKRLPKGNSLQETPNAHPYLRVTDMKMGGIDQSKLLYVPEEIAPSIKRYRVSAGDLFITVAGTLGVVGKIPKDLHGANLTENADMLTDIKCDKNYLLYSMMSPHFQKAIENATTQNAQPKLALSRIRDFSILLPSIDEQRRISSSIEASMQRIAIQEKNLNHLKQEKKALMQQLLTGKRRVKVDD